MAIEWVKKHCSREDCKGGDVFVSATTHKRNDKSAARFIFRNGSEKRITKLSHIAVGYQAGRVYFMGAETSAGYKLVEANGDKRLTVWNDRLARHASTCRGVYEFEYDKGEGLYYITLMKKEASK